MKKFILLTLLFCFTKTKAQFVTISDTAFASYLNMLIPTAMSGNLLDTTNPLVTTTTHTISVSKKHIANLSGIQYFTSLIFLRCDSNQLTTLPTLPASLNYLKCNNQFYDSSGYSILTLTNLPALPASLTYLNCSSNNLTALPTLPNTLKFLDCGYTNLPSIATLPNTLTHLSCNNIEVTTFTTLPALPNSLSFLDCSKHYCVPCMGPPPPQGFITSLPILPNQLDTLMCGYNRITCFQPFPTSITFIDIDDNNNYCLPNYIRAMSRNDTINFPLCGIGSPCPISPRCTSTVSFSLTPDITPHTWDVSPTYPSNIVKATWFWGDGTYTANTLYPSHIYSTPGSYQIGVEIIDALNCYTDFSQTDSVYRYANNSTYSNMVQINVLSNVTTINQTTINNQLNIYPNPAQNNFTIETNLSEKQMLFVFDVNGKLVLNQFIQGKTTIDASSLNAGVYSLNITSNQGTQTKKLVIVK